MKPFKAIAAMSENRVIGRSGQIPWHLPEDFKWFKQATLGHALVMGRKTFESIGRALPGRTTFVLSRSGFTHPDVTTVGGLEDLGPIVGETQCFICGGAEIYQAALPYCSDLYLTMVERTVEGDTLFPPFEHLFAPGQQLFEGQGFKVIHYTNLHPLNMG